jgi:ADP-glucose pyrophosphorylase
LNLELASGSFSWPGVEPRDGCILPGALEPRASVRRSVIGPEADIAPGVQLDRCVVWPGTRVSKSATNAVLTPEHRIELS